MRSLARTFSAIALAAAVALVPAAAASAAGHKDPKAQASWAKKNHLKGSWRTKDADHDGLANLREYKLKTDPKKADTDRDGLGDGDELKVGDNPRKADSDGDKVKDGAEHAGVVAAYDGDTLTLRQFKGAKLTATLAGDVDCTTVDDSSGDDTSSDDTSSGDGSAGDGYWPGDDTSSPDDPGADDGAAATVDDDPAEVDLGAGDATAGDGTDAAAACEDAGVAKGALVRSATVERRDGKLYVTSLELV